ncbi:hypothetical protein [Dyella jiangningensis]|uniref:hypothetical protein n=1 Tax=Dyella jiangningensis TaxID=1379159 RepID=UPI001558FDDF|nr:hypothetical protein [Dyella jiangningensis]
MTHPHAMEDFNDGLAKGLAQDEKAHPHRVLPLAWRLSVTVMSQQYQCVCGE